MKRQTVLSHNMFTTRTMAMLFTISIAAIFFLIYSDNTGVTELSEMINLQHQNAKQIMVESLHNLTPLENIAAGDEVDKEFEESMILPKNVTTREERLFWYRTKLPKSNFFKSDELALKFHGRVLDFLDKGHCTVRFFMTWFAPAKRFGRRTFFAVESLFKTNPNGYLIIVSRTLDTKRGYKTLKPLIDLGFRVIAVTPDVNFLLKNTPAENWIKEIVKGNKDPGAVALPQNLSNLLRLAVIYKYGGIYLDSDLVLLRDMSRLRNVIGAQSMDSSTKQWRILNNAALVFDREHPILHAFMEEFALTFDGNKWGHNGPNMVSRVINRTRTCDHAYNLTVLPRQAFYPVVWVEIQRFLKKPRNEIESTWVKKRIDMLKDGTTYGIHLWYTQIRGSEIEEGSVLARLISEYCIVCVGY